MILNIQRHPDFSLYSLGGILLEILEQVKVIPIEKLLEEVQQRVKKRVHVDFIYYALDWLYLLELVKIEEGEVYYENKKINSKQKDTL
ncbi:ABC-three component system middle component 6 [Parvimonas sp. G1425]|uniref:ABC-three component system middle component 6 n=1 Tax=Parvimonas sp. G1425 TaxID=3387694 RepID=UPI0039E2ABCE